MNKPARAICCVVTKDYIPGFIVLYTSIFRHQTIPLYLLVSDIEPSEAPSLSIQLQALFREPVSEFLHLVTPFQIYGEAASQMRFYYDAFEFATAAKAGIHAWMQEHTDVECWLYLDTDMLCFGSLDPIFDQLQSASILLTPHLAHPAPSLAGDLQNLAAGAFNGGVLGVRRSDESQRFTRWYQQVLEFFCLNDPPLSAAERFTQATVIFSDQRWLDLVPAYFPATHVAAQRGFNVGHWNVEQDQLNRQSSSLYIGNDPVILLHLSGLIADAPNRLSKHSPIDWSGSTVWQQIHSDYVQALMPLKQVFSGHYRYSSYPNGSAVPKAHRRLYLKHILAGGPRIEDPFQHQADFERACAPKKAPMPYRWA
jgi:hypothetical protein